ncbi:MAG TPA: flagellar filament capping protein FliD [Myxococcales bacterium]|nr:flagellar filament capping protein FliD [Myxococcales bacterium]
MTTAATFTAGGLSSGLDTNTLIDSLVKLQSRPLTMLQSRQAGLKTQLSTLGDLTSRLGALQTAAAALAKSGVVGGQVSTSAAGFTATAASGVSAGRYSVRVQALARAAQARSASFASESAQVKGGMLHLAVKGATPKDVEVKDGASLSDVASAINGSGASVQAAVVFTGSAAYLTISNRDTGVPLDHVTPALAVTMDVDGVKGQALGAVVTDAGANATFTLSGIPDVLERQSNQVSDVIPGVTLSLKSITTSAEELVVTRDTAATAANLQKLIGAYNDVLKLLQKNLQVDQNTDRDASLAGDGSVRALQASLHGLVSAKVPGLGTVRAVADVGIKTQRDGSLALDQTVLQAALDRDAGAVDQLFAQSKTGLSAVVTKLVDGQTNVVDGVLTSSKSSLNKRVKQMDAEAVRLQDRLDAFRAGLIAQFTAMEKVVGQIKSVGQFLTMQESSKEKS